MASSLREGLSPAEQQQFERLRQHFAAGLSARWLEIQGAPNTEIAQTALHRLSGSAGSYGFERLSACARSAEALTTAGGGVPLTQALALLQVEIGLAQSAVAAAA